MSTSSESVEGDIELTFTRDAARPGYASIQVTYLGEEGAAFFDILGSFDIRDLLIALHALTPAVPAAVVADVRPVHRAVSRFFERKGK